MLLQRAEVRQRRVARHVEEPPLPLLQGCQPKTLFAAPSSGKRFAFGGEEPRFFSATEEWREKGDGGGECGQTR
jgi:hypothetical protein